MVVINKNIVNELRWLVLKGLSDTHEDFSNSTVTLYVITETNKFFVSSTIDGDTIKANLSGLSEGTYDTELIWIKNDRNVNRTHQANVFKVTTNAPANKQIIDVVSTAHSYGYDGLSSYELACIHGETILDEASWILNITDVNNRFTFVEKCNNIGQYVSTAMFGACTDSAELQSIFLSKGLIGLDKIQSVALRIRPTNTNNTKCKMYIYGVTDEEATAISTNYIILSNKRGYYAVWTFDAFDIPEDGIIIKLYSDEEEPTLQMFGVVNSAESTTNMKVIDKWDVEHEWTVGIGINCNYLDDRYKADKVYIGEELKKKQDKPFEVQVDCTGAIPESSTTFDVIKTAHDAGKCIVFKVVTDSISYEATADYLIYHNVVRFSTHTAYIEAPTMMHHIVYVTTDPDHGGTQWEQYIKSN